MRFSPDDQMAAVCAGNRVLVLDVQVRGGCGWRASAGGGQSPPALCQQVLTGRVSVNTGEGEVSEHVSVSCNGGPWSQIPGARCCSPVDGGLAMTTGTRSHTRSEHGPHVFLVSVRASPCGPCRYLSHQHLLPLRICPSHGSFIRSADVHVLPPQVLWSLSLCGSVESHSGQSSAPWDPCPPGT